MRLTISVSLLQAALDYATRGIHVFPLLPGSKAPATANGVHDATVDAHKIRTWWQIAPNHGIGIACGPSGLLVVDVDARAGFPSAAHALDVLGLPPTYAVVTPNGGWHFYFRSVLGLGNSVNRLAEGVDTRGAGGYVVAPPTPGYELYFSDTLAVLPTHVATALQKPADVGIKAPIDPVEVLGGVPEGRRNDTLFRYACRLRGLGLAEEEGAILVDLAAANCDPPLGARLSADITSRVWDTYPAPETPQNAKYGPLRPIYDFASEPTVWLWHLRVPLGKLTVVAGVQGQGKSYLTTALAADVSQGRQMPGGVGPGGQGKPLPPSSVILGAYEDGIGDTVRPRLEAMGANLGMIHMLGFWKDDSNTPRPFRVSDVPILEESLTTLPDCRLLVIDPITAFLGGKVDGNSNEQVRDALESLVSLAEKYAIAVVAVAHLNKAELSSALYRVSGANAFTALPRSVLLVGRDPGSGRRGIGHVKCNLGPLADVVEFHISDDGFRWGNRVSDLPVADLLKSK